MAKANSLETQEKKELASKQESTVPGRYYVPNTDIYETDDALTVVMEIPGVETKNVTVKLDNDVLHVEGRIDLSNYGELQPLYTEYNVGHFGRAFTLSNKIDRQEIGARLDDGVLVLTLKKAREAQPRRIPIG